MRGAFPELETKNLILRAATQLDVAGLFQVFADAEVMRYHDLEPLTRLEQVQQLIDRWQDRFNRGRGIRWGIARKTDNILVGSCGYSYSNSHLADLGYELAKAHWQQGIMSEALEAVIAFGFETMGLHRIQAMVMLKNTASMTLLKKLGFLEEGVLREAGYWKGQFHDLKLFSLLKRDDG